MQRILPAPLWRRAKKATALFSDADVDDDLLRHHIGLLFLSPATLYGSFIMGVLITGSAWLMTHRQIFLVYAFINLAITSLRIALTRRYASKPSHDRDTREVSLSYDKQFLILAACYTVLLGLMNCSLAMLSREINAAPLATSVTVGYAVAIVTRNSCRLRTLFAQILAICGPMIIGYAFWIPIANGLLYAALLVCLVIITMMMGVAANAKMTELFRANQKTSRIARYDVLTGLLNRFSFGDALETMLAHASNGFVESFAIITIDLDRFKEINDTLGHNIGDAVIVEMAARLTRVVGAEDIVARLGGDEFVVLAKGRRNHDYGVVA